MKYIPKNIAFVIVPKTKEAKNHSENLLFAYIVDSDKKEQIDSAKMKVSRKSTKDLIFCYENTPMTGLTIDNFTITHYKENFIVYNSDKICFEVNAQEILQCMINHGIGKGGVLGGEWVVGRGNGHSYVLLVGSEEHKKFVEGSKFEENLKKVKASEIVPGYIFKTKREEAYWYVGDLKENGISKQIAYRYYFNNTDKKHSTYSYYNYIPKTLYFREKISDELKKELLSEAIKNAEEKVVRQKAHIVNAIQDNASALTIKSIWNRPIIQNIETLEKELKENELILNFLQKI